MRGKGWMRGARLAAVSMTAAVVVMTMISGATGVSAGADQPDPAAAKKEPSQVAVAKRLARRVDAAKSDRGRYRALQSTMKTLNLGVYSGAGKTIVPGSDRKRDDPYLYKFEMQMLSKAIGRDERWTLDELAAEVSSAGLATSAGPLTAAELRKALEGAARRALKRERSPRSLGTLLIAELGRHGKSTYDLSDLKPGDGVELDALQRALLLADITLGIRQAKAATASRSVPRRGPDCSGTSNKRIYRIGSFVLGELPVVSDVIKLPVISVWHAWIVGTGIDYRVVGDSSEFGHYGPRDHDEGDPTSKIAGEEIEFTVELEMLDQLSKGQIKCGALVGYRIPDKGGVDGIEIDWDGSSDNYEELLDHGTVTRQDPETDGNGRATFRFKPRDEVFAGIGPVEHERGSIGPEALIMNSLGNAGAVLENFGGRPQFVFWDIGFHAQRATVDFSSRVVLPPEAYYLDCQADPDCTLSGQTILRVKSSVPVEYDRETGRVSGRAQLDLVESTGQVTKTDPCTSGGAAVNRVRMLGTGSAGELVVPNLTGGVLRGGPTANLGLDLSRAVLEDIVWDSTNCDGTPTPINGLQQQHAQWAIHWTELHRPEEVITADGRWILGGFGFDGSVFDRVDQRSAQVTIGRSYQVLEDTKITVTPR